MADGACAFINVVTRNITGNQHRASHGIQSHVLKKNNSFNVVVKPIFNLTMIQIAVFCLLSPLIFKKNDVIQSAIKQQLAQKQVHLPGN